MTKLNSSTRTRAIIILCAVLLGVCFTLLVRAAFLSDAWTPSDTIAVSLGIVIALTQVLLVYAWIEPNLKSMRRQNSDKAWQEAVREFLAFCSMSAHDLSRNLAYHLAPAENDQRIIGFKHGIFETLVDISNRSRQFDTMTQFIAMALSDRDRAELSEISGRLRACGATASSASERLKLLEPDIPPMAKLDEAGSLANTYHRSQMPGDAQGLEKQRYWLVRDIEEVIEPLIDACLGMEKFAFEPRGINKANPEGFVEGSLRYRRAQDRQRKKRAKQDLSGDSANPNNETVASHRKILQEAVAELRRHKTKIENQGVCIAWLPELAPDAVDPDNEPDKRA